jgi:DNA-binding PadR family transcriptional regulator
VANVTPTQTSYAVLGLLAVKPWTTYELARQSERSLRFFFPRAERAVYLEAKRLVVLGWAQSKKESTGRRTSTVYRITAAGRRALRTWLAAPSTPTQLGSEPMMKLFYIDQAPEQMRAVIESIRTDAAEVLTQLGAQASTDSAFPERMPTNVLSMRLVTDVHAALVEWSEWASGAAAVLESGDAKAIEAQTREALRAIAATVPAPTQGAP